MPPCVPVLALEPHLARQLVGDERGSRVALVLARRADIIDACAADLERRDEPAPEGMVDLERDLARERARNPEQDRLVDSGTPGKLHSGERAGEPGERWVERQTGDPRQRRVLVIALDPAQRRISRWGARRRGGV